MVLNGKVQQGFFPTQDEAFHAKLRRVVANAYAMTTLVQFEPLVDSTISAFIRQLDTYADQPGEKGVVDFGLWLQWYAFDVIGELTFSKRLGFLDEAKDVDHIISDNDKLLDYFAVVSILSHHQYLLPPRHSWTLAYSLQIGQVPWLDKFLLKNPIRLWCTSHGIIDATAPVGTFAKERMAERLAKLETEGNRSGVEQEEELGSTRKRRDFLSRFLEASKKNPEIMDNRRVTSFCSLNMFAGSDTTGISLRAIFYYLLKNPYKLARLLKELDDPKLGSKTQFVSWETSQKLPYLSAVIQEALRLHPAVGLPLERIVPPSGLQFKDAAIPPGTIVGTTAWGLHHSKSIFGPDPEAFRPERWIESPKEQLSLMNSMLFSFGMGSRTCIGKNISLLEMYKLVPTLLRRYEVCPPPKLLCHI